MTKPLIFNDGQKDKALFTVWQGSPFNLHAAGASLRAEGWTFSGTTPESSGEPTGDAYWQVGHRVFEIVPFTPEIECCFCNGTGQINDGYEMWSCVHCTLTQTTPQ